MPAQFSFLRSSAALGMLLAFVAGCGAKSVGRSTITSTIGARTVKASVDGGGFISSEGTTATISCGAGKIVIEKDRVVLDGKELAKIPAAAAKIDVDYSNGALTVTADGTQVFPVGPGK